MVKPPGSSSLQRETRVGLEEMRERFEQLALWVASYILLVTKLQQLWAKRPDMILGNVVILVLAFTSMAVAYFTTV